MERIQPGVRLTGPFWPEPVEGLQVQRQGDLLRLVVLGEASQRYYGEYWLRPEGQDQPSLLVPRGPDFSGAPMALFLGAEAQRMRLSYQFDPLQALHVSMIDPLPHQIDAVYFHMLPQARLRFLLADDPGAGKTIMAGLLLKELKYRGLVERVPIVVPGHLRDQWLRALREKFGETLWVVDRALLQSSYGRNPWREYPQILTSLAFAKQDDVLQSLDGSNWDLVIVDEAHKLAAYRYGEKTKKTQRYRLGEVLSRNFRMFLFLSATPHRGDPENFQLLLALLDPDLFAKAELVEGAVRRGENPLVLRRLTEDLKTVDGTPIFPPRHVHTVVFPLSPEEMEFYNALTRYVREGFNRARDAEPRNVQLALTLLPRRLASSLYAARKSLERRKDRLRRVLEKGELLRERGELDEGELEGLPEGERWGKEEELRAEIAALGDLLVQGRELERPGVETKLNELRELLATREENYPGEKLVIFTESRDPLECLAAQARRWGYTVAVLHGGMNLEGRIRAEAEFRERAQILISTEAGGEGINLQCASLAVNYDIPWNPNRLEQRMGRVHRDGQQKEVHIFNLVAGNTVEGEVLRRLFHKLEEIRAAMGSDRVFDVIQGVPFGQARIRAATAEALATRHIDFFRILGEERRAKENLPEYVEAFFARATNHLGLPARKGEDGLWRVGPLPAWLRTQGAEFRAHFGEVRESYRRLTFHKDEALRKGGEFIAPGHPLFEAVVGEILRRTSPECERGAVFRDPRGRLSGTIFFLEATVVDGSGEVAGKRIFSVFVSPDGRWDPVPPAILYDLEPAGGAVSWDPPDPERVRAFVAQTLLPQLLAEVRAERERQAQIRRYGLKSLGDLLLEAEGRLLDLEMRRAAGEEIPAMVFDQARSRREALERRKRNLEARIQQETTLIPGEIRVLAACAVLPAPVSPEEQLVPDVEVERMGMEAVMAYERAHGRTPVDGSKGNLGSDVRSEGPGEVRYIEVKARARPGHREAPRTQA